jgi:PIN domain nuclease of toxin-antitoxin system
MVRPKRASAKRSAKVSEPELIAPQRLLLDTHVWLWWQANDRRLGHEARRAITAAAEVWFSAASVWEISVKSSLGKLKLPRGADIEEELRRDGFAALAVELAHAVAVKKLPGIHRDPFDRMLVAQASVEGLRLVTAHAGLARYEVSILNATE